MIEERVMQLMEKRKQIKEKLSNHSISFIECENELKLITNEFEEIIQENTLNALIEPTTLNSIPCKCGFHARYKGIQIKVLNTGRSEIKISRRYYYCEKCKTKRYPLDEAYGLQDVKEYTPLMICIMSYLASKMSYEESRKTIEELLNIKVSATAVQNQSEKLGKEISQQKFSFIPPECQKPCERMLILADGGMIHTGKAEYKETRVGVVVKLYANEGFFVHKIAICENAEDFCSNLNTFCRLHGSDECQDIAIIGDGAGWLDTFKTDYFWNAVRIVDYYHAKEYLIDALKDIYGEEWALKDKSYYLVGLLENGECLQISKELQKEYLKNDKTDNVFKAIRYYENHWEKMQYKEYEKQGYPIGSGEVEGGVKNIVHERMGKSRSTWTIPDANAILILRAFIINCYWEYVKHKRFQAVYKTRNFARK